MSMNGLQIILVLIVSTLTLISSLRSEVVQYGADTIAGAGGWQPLNGSGSPIALAGIDSSSGMGAYTPSVSGGRLVFDLSGAPNGGTVTVTDGTTTYNAEIVTVSDTYSAATWAEVQAAVSDIGAAGGKTILVRPWSMDTSANNQLVNGVEFASQLVVKGESANLSQLSGGIEIRHTDNVMLDNLDIYDPTGALFAILGVTGECDLILVDGCSVHGVYRDPLGDYSSAGSYANSDSGIRMQASGGFNPTGFTFRNGSIYDVKTATTLTMGSGSGAGLTIEDNEIYHIYSDAIKWNLTTGGLDLPVRIDGNVMHGIIGRPTDADNPHVDMVQFISSAGVDGQQITDVQITNNVAWLDESARGGGGVQGITSFEDSGGRIVFKDAVVSGNLMVLDGNHHLTLQAEGGNIANNTLLAPDPAGLNSLWGDGQVTIRVFGTGGVSLTDNIYEESPYQENSNTLSGNLQVGNNGSTFGYASIFTGPDWSNETYGATVSAFTPLSGTVAEGKGWSVSSPSPPVSSAIRTDNSGRIKWTPGAGGVRASLGRPVSVPSFGSPTVESLPVSGSTTLSAGSATEDHWHRSLTAFSFSGSYTFNTGWAALSPVVEFLDGNGASQIKLRLQADGDLELFEPDGDSIAVTINQPISADTAYTIAVSGTMGSGANASITVSLNGSPVITTSTGEWDNQIEMVRFEENASGSVTISSYSQASAE